MASKLEMAARSLDNPKESITSEAKRISKLLKNSWRSNYSYLVAKRAGYSSSSAQKKHYLKENKIPGWTSYNEIRAIARGYDSSNECAHGPTKQKRFEHELFILPSEELDVLEDAHQEVGIEKEEIMKVIVQVLSGLSPRERYVIEQRYFVKEPKTLEDVSAEMGISTPERVRQIEKNAIGRIYFKVRYKIGQDTPGGSWRLKYWENFIEKLRVAWMKQNRKKALERAKQN